LGGAVNHGAIYVTIILTIFPKTLEASLELLANLTTLLVVGKLANMPATLITRFKDITADGAILELVVWKVPAPVPPTEHGYKYRAVYAVDGVRVVGFDNERGKGDHCHLDGVELPYTFAGVEKLVEDFIAAVAARRAP
jgi:Family of unknown function (DUF6516)